MNKHRPFHPIELFSRHYIPEPMSGCWLWTSYANKKGYGVMRIGRKTAFAHRVSYELHKGQIQDGLVIDHLCCNSYCVNPDHLEPVTQQENTRRHWFRFDIETHCRRGHRYTTDNNPLRPNGVRKCRICEREEKKKIAEHKKSLGLAWRRNKDIVGWVDASIPSKRGRNQFNYKVKD